MESATSMSADTQDVDKSLFDAEQFLSNFTNIREECERLKNENHELQMRVQQLSQDLSHCQLDKQNLERHVQKETLHHKETVWNLKLEIQKSQEERLSWKEKFLDLCIKSSQNVAEDLSLNKEFESNSSQDKENKKVSRKGKKPRSRKKQKIEQKQEVSTSVEAPVCMEEEIVNKNEQQPTSNMEDGVVVSAPHSVNKTVPSEVEPLTLETGLSEDTSNMNTSDMVTSLDTNLNVSADVTQGHVVSADTTDYYSLQAASFDLNNQGQPVSGNTTTFILQTSDATFCATAVIDDTQRSAFSNAGVAFPATNNTFNNQSTFDNSIPDSDSDSEENTEFNFRCNLCNFTYSDQQGLDKHMKAKHTAKTNLCKECGKAYSTKSSLAQHVHHYHRHPMAYTCDVCDKKFNRKDFLIKHAKTHTDERTFKCNHCDKQFKTSASLSAHVNGTHNDTRRFVCDYCGMRTSWRLSYLEHMKLHTGEPRKSGRKKKQLQQHQQLHHQDLQLVAEPGTVVQFIATADG